MFFSHEHVKSPATKSDIVAIVRIAAEKGQKVRVVGSGHSWSPVATTEEVLVSLWNYSGVVSGRDSPTVCAANFASYQLLYTFCTFHISLYSFFTHSYSSALLSLSLSTLSYFSLPFLSLLLHLILLPLLLLFLHPRPPYP